MGHSNPPDDLLRDVDLTMAGPVEAEMWLGAPALSYPRRPRTLVEVLDRAARRWPDAMAMVDEGGATATYAEFGRLARAHARWQHQRGVRAGDRVVVAGRNRLETAVALFGCAIAGTIFVGVNLRLAADEWTYMISRSGARLALAQPDLLPDVTVAAGKAGLAADAVLPLELPDPAGTDEQPLPTPAEDRTFQLVWTSGTTGRPKGSQVVHRCTVHSGMSYQKVLELRPGDRTAVLFPLYYISALHAHVVPAMLAGATCVLVEHADQQRWLRLLMEHRIAWAYAVPSWWSMVIRDPALCAENLPHLRVAAAGGAPFPAELVAALRERLPHVRLIDIYGLSETHSPATMLMDDEFVKRPGSVGRALPCMEVAIRDDAGRTLPPGQPGEIHLRGSLVTTGYWDDPTATAASTVDGWFHTGDIGRLDADGYLFILDRKKDMINRGGHKVFSAEVERVIRQLPGIADVAVVGIPDRLAGEAVAAAVVLEPQTRVTALQVRRWVRDNLADYAAPQAVEFVDALPRNATGKTDKLALRRRLAGDGAGPDNAGLGTVPTKPTAGR